MDSYLVRIYRRAENDPKMLVGVVREIGTEEKRVFNSFDELWSILNPREKGRTRHKKGTANNGNRGKNGL